MKKHAFKYLVILILSIVIILGLIYLGLGYYYKDSFSFGTWINGGYCTGMSVDEVDTRLNENYSYEGIEVVSENGDALFFVNAKDIEFTYDFKEALNIYLKSNNEWLWISNLMIGKNRTLNPVVHLDEEKLDELLAKENSIRSLEEAKVEIVFDENGEYKLVDTMMHRPITDKIEAAIKSAINESNNEFVLTDEYYEDAIYDSKALELIDEFTDLQTNMNSDITFVFGDDKEHINDEILTSFLKRDENGKLVRANTENVEKTNDSDISFEGSNAETDVQVYEWNDEAIDAWIDSLCEKYDTLGKTRLFKTSSGKEIEVSGGIYGNKIDAKKEKEYLKNAVRAGLKEEHEPEYTQKALKQGLDDIGDTYIEVNMTDQMLYYYVDGELIIETPVVTGNMLLGRDTPVGVNYVYFKQRNRTLRGPGYASFVKYWIPVKGAIGIHDASWRDEYGGDIYLTDGSHGCINTPEEEVSKLYDMVEIGTPAVMFYME